MPLQAKITMFGGKNVGKTCFMHGMYGVLRRGVHNFFLHANDINDDNRLSQGWAALTKRGTERRWPVPTNVGLSRHEFAFKRGMNHTLMDFEWIDYRGGALLEDAESAGELLEHIVNSDCLFFCFDGAELREPLGNRIHEIDHRSCISRAKVLLDNLPRRIPIAVLVTKHDLCQHRPQRDLLKEIEKLFDSWLVKGEGWEVMFCPISLGNELARDREGGSIDPRNLHLPLVYAVFSLMVAQLVRQEREVKRSHLAQRSAAAKLKQLGGNFLLDVWNQKELEQARRDHETLAQQLKRQQAELQNVREDIAILGRELSKAVIYSDGERVLVG